MQADQTEQLLQVLREIRDELRGMRQNGKTWNVVRIRSDNREIWSGLENSEARARELFDSINPGSDRVELLCRDRTGNWERIDSKDRFSERDE